jgi:hypothetical protein
VFRNFELKIPVETDYNPKGVLEVNGADDPCYFAYLKKGKPNLETGKVSINNLSDESSILIEAHDSSINCMRFNFKGNYFATASKKVNRINFREQLSEYFQVKQDI